MLCVASIVIVIVIVIIVIACRAFVSSSVLSAVALATLRNGIILVGTKAADVGAAILRKVIVVVLLLMSLLFTLVVIVAVAGSAFVSSTVLRSVASTTFRHRIIVVRTEPTNRSAAIFGIFSRASRMACRMHRAARVIGRARSRTFGRQSVTYQSAFHTLSVARSCFRLSASEGRCEWQ